MLTKKKWLKGMQKEVNSLHENHTFELMNFPKSKSTQEQMGVQNKSEGNKYRPRY
jgi:hypothetical protein